MYSELACSRRSDSGVLGEVREREKSKEEQEERAGERMELALAPSGIYNSTE